MRKALVEHDYVDCMVQLTGQLFANTQIPCSLWFLSKNRKGGNRYRKRTGEVLFIDGRKLGTLIPGSRKQKHVDRMKRLVFSLRLKSAFQQRGAQATTSLRRPAASSYLRVRRILAARYEPTPKFRGAVLADRPRSREGQSMECGSVSVRIGRPSHVLGARRDGPLDPAHRRFRRAPWRRGRGGVVSDVQSRDPRRVPANLPQCGP